MTARLDKWLWAVRLFRTRSLAASAIRAGGVSVNDRPAKPARTVHAGETVVVWQGGMTRTVRVVGVPPGRVGAQRVPEFCTDLTPPEEFAKRPASRMERILARPKGAGRPTKRDRRALDRLLG